MENTRPYTLMKNDNEKPPRTRVRQIKFPWLSAMTGILTMAYLLLLLDRQLLSFYQIPEAWLGNEWGYALIATFFLVLLFDLHRYHRQHIIHRQDVQALREQVHHLWENRKQLQLKAHTYSGHADRLKLFISDKLLDYIEYDEKFLHFKSIAAEVRHNGVICFDKVQIALRQASADWASRTTEGEQTPDASSNQYQLALDSMRYLWDLLDLSTADNLALHIGNLLCEYEEHYYQQLLNGNRDKPLPYDPVYQPQTAAWRALSLVYDESLPTLVNKQDYSLNNSQWYVHLKPVSGLLGNENHLVLLLENLLKNAQFFSRKRGYKSPFPPLALSLHEQQGEICLRVYNRGPHIREEDIPNLFQLGFSTRRTREHHGRGLGLYFVDQIIKAYEGRILVHNIHTPETRYAVRMEMENGDVVTNLIDLVIQDGQVQCRLADGGLDNAVSWTFKSPLHSVEVTTTDSHATQETQRLTGFTNKGKQSFFDPAYPAYPQWRLDYQPRRNAHQLRFEPLDIDGVEFEIFLPSARQRLENNELTHDDDFDAEFSRMDKRFREHTQLQDN